MKSLLPSLKERKRYLAFEVMSKDNTRFSVVSKAVWSSILSFIGIKGAAKAGIWLLSDKYKNNKGLIRVGHKYVDDLKASLALIKNIDSEDVIVRSLGVSGILNKAEVYLK